MRTRLLSIALLGALCSMVHAAQLVAIDDAQRAAFGIETVAVTTGSSALSKPYPARVSVPNASLRVVGSPLEGVIEALLVAEGESVSAGQTLARIRSQGLLELQAAYLESRTRRQLSGENLARDRKLHAEGIVAQRRLLESQASHREMVTAEARDRQALLLAGMPEPAIDELGRTGQLNTVLEVTAPIAGVILEQIATAGQRLAASDPLYRLGDLATLWIEIHVPLDLLGRTAPGSEVVLGNGLTATVITVGHMVHGTDQGVLVRATIAAGADRLRPGQFVEARLAPPAAAVDALRVPTRALVRIDGREKVFVQRPEGFEAVAVDVVAHEDEEVVLSGPLAAGDAVVVSGTVALKAALAAGSE